MVNAAPIIENGENLSVVGAVVVAEQAAASAADIAKDAMVAASGAQVAVATVENEQQTQAATLEELDALCQMNIAAIAELRLSIATLTAQTEAILLIPTQLEPIKEQLSVMEIRLAEIQEAHTRMGMEKPDSSEKGASQMEEAESVPNAEPQEAKLAEKPASEKRERREPRVL